MATRLVGVESTIARLPDVVVKATSPQFDVKAYGAKGDGTTDDTTAIQAAITAAGANGTVVFPHTTAGYKTTATLNVAASGVTLSGPGSGAAGINYTGTGTAVKFGSSGAYVYRVAAENLNITDTGGTGLIGMELYCRESKFTNVVVQDGFSTAGWILMDTSSVSGCWSCRFTNCAALNGTGDGVQVRRQSNAVVFIGCQFSSNAGDNVFVPSTNGARFIGCQFENAGSGYEIHVTDRATAFICQVVGLSVENCYFEVKPATAGARCLKMDGAGSARFTFSHCHVYGMTTAVYAVEGNFTTGSAWGEVTDNTVYGVTTAIVGATAATSRIFVTGRLPYTQGFPSGTPGALLDNTGGGRGCSLNPSDLEWLLTGKLHGTGELELDGTLNHDGTAVGFYGTAPVARPGSVSPKVAIEALGLGANILGRPHFDIRDYGAIGGGVTNDTTAIQAAVTACGAAGGGYVMFPAVAGGYRLNSTLNITDDGVVLVGPGLGMVGINWTGTGVAVQFGDSTTYVYRCGIRNLRITDSSAGGGTVGLELFCRESLFVDTYVHQGFTTAQWRVNGTTSPVAGCWSCRFISCYATNGTGDGMQIFAQANAIRLFGCRFASSAGDNVYIPITNGASFIGCQFENAGSGYEIHVSDRSAAFTSQALGLNITDCYFELKAATAGARALKVEGTTSTRFSFTGNYVYGAAAATHAVEGTVSSGQCRGDLRDNMVHGVTTAHALAATSAVRIGVWDYPGQSGTWPAGSALTLLDNTGGGRGVSMNVSDQEMLLTGKLHITGNVQNDGTLIPRVASIATSATPTITATSTDVYIITALAAAITSVTISGTPQVSQRLHVAITDNGTARALAWGASFESSGTVALPTTTVISTRLDVDFIYNAATSKFRCIQVA